MYVMYYSFSNLLSLIVGQCGPSDSIDEFSMLSNLRIFPL